MSRFSAEPHFLHAIDYGNYIYFFFSEIAVEYTAIGKVPVLVGGQHVTELPINRFR